MNRIFSVLTAAVLCILAIGSSAQELPGKRDSINSAALGQKRFIQVVLPPGYKPGSADKYDVIYVTDGDDNTRTMADVEAFVSREGFMPQAIIVGVLNIDRGKDLTPTHVNDSGNSTSGGAPQFLAFFKDELIPYINKTYPADGDNILFGHSLGGLFVTYVLLNEPEVFKSYIAADPSYWWDNRYMLPDAAKKLPSLAGMQRSIYITGRAGQGMREMAIDPMDTLFQKYAPPAVAWKVTSYANETHGTIRLKTMYDGLRFIYQGFRQRAPEFHPMAGIMLKDKPIKIWDFDDDTSKAHYTIDGSMPTGNSPNITKTMMLNSAGTFTVKVFTSNDKFDKSASGVFTEGPALPPSRLSKDLNPGGLHYAYYEGEWSKLPDFSKLKPVKEGFAGKDFDIGKMPKQQNFGVVFTGQFEAKQDGYYLFALVSDDGSKLFLNGKALVDNDGLHDASRGKSYIVPLKKGFYPIRLEYFQKDEGVTLKLVYIAPDKMDARIPDAVPVPDELLYGRN
ncbi:MAG TPA: alpha/beta hydrolase-fold protein [Mucilaginibacter sp.]|nr:alpha/beta hydrolase-fold protein [Mucilaginibacter sp.]